MAMCPYCWVQVWKEKHKLFPGTYLDQRIGNLIVHLLSGLINEIGPIKGELFGWLICCSGLLYEALAPVQVHGQRHLRAQSLLPVIQGPAPDHHLHRLWPHVSPFKWQMIAKKTRSICFINTCLQSWGVARSANANLDSAMKRSVY